MHLDYLFLRFIRHIMPSSYAHSLLRNRILLTPGPETRNPRLATNQYRDLLSQYGQTFTGKRILIFGYGGNFAVGCMILKAGAQHVILCDRYTTPDDRVNATLLEEFGDYLTNDGNHVLPRGERISLLQADIRQVDPSSIPKVDLALSRSVYEHLDDVEGVTRVLTALTKPDGFHLHIINLSDHFFKYPFEMLAFSAETWEKWLNPTSNLNRYRFMDYRRIFEEHFETVQASVWENDRQAFDKAHPRIRGEFLTGNSEIDSAVKMILVASRPQNQASIRPVSI